MLRTVPSVSIIAILVLAMIGLCACGSKATQQAGEAQPDFAGAEVDFGSVEEKVFFIEPKDGDEVVSPFRVSMGAQAVILRRPFTDQQHYGHHHLLIDAPLPSAGQKIPNDEQHRHFHGSEEEAILSLPPGEHTLRLLFGYAYGLPYEPTLTDEVTITVKAQRRVFFTEPKDGDDIKEVPFRVAIGTEGLEDLPGHLVIIADHLAPEVPPAGKPVPSGDKYIHFAEGQTEAMVDLPPKGHNLRLVYVDADNVPFDPPIMESVNVVVWGAILEPDKGGEGSYPAKVLGTEKEGKRVLTEIGGVMGAPKEAPASKTIAAPQEDAVPSTDAAKYIGETRTVCGPVVDAQTGIGRTAGGFQGDKGSETSLAFDQPFPSPSFQVIIVEADFDMFPPDREEYYKGEEICITGSILSLYGKPYIRGMEASQLEVIR